MKRSARLVRQGLLLLLLFAAPRCFVTPRAPCLRKSSAPLKAAFWDEFLSGSLVDVPLNATGLSAQLQDVIFTSVEKALPQVDIDLPAGLVLGVEGDDPDELKPRMNLSKAEEERGDRELAGAIVQFFHEFKNAVNLCVLFRSPARAQRARAAWGDFGKARVVGFPSKKTTAMQAGSPAERLAQLIRNRPFVVAVAPRKRQLEALQELSQSPDIKMLLVLLNARVRCLPQDCKDIRSEVAIASNPVFHARFVGTDGEAMLYRSMNTPWVLARREGGRELLRSDDEPSLEAVLTAAASS